MTVEEGGLARGMSGEGGQEVAQEGVDITFTSPSQ